MDTIFMNSKKSKTSVLHLLILKFTDKLDLEVKIELSYQILVLITHGKT